MDTNSESRAAWDRLRGLESEVSGLRRDMRLRRWTVVALASIAFLAALVPAAKALTDNILVLYTKNLAGTADVPRIAIPGDSDNVTARVETSAAGGTNLQICATSNQLVLGGGNGGSTSATTMITSGTPVASRTYTLPDTGANSSFVMTDLAQTLNGTKTFTSGVVITPTTAQLVLGTGNTTTITSPAPAASRTLTIPTSADAGQFVLTTGTGNEGLRVIRGRFNGTTVAVVDGTGFTVARTGGGNAAGDYTVTFSTAFSTAPTVVAGTDQGSTLRGGAAYLGSAPTTTNVRILRGVFNMAAGGTSDGFVSFVAIGPP